MILIFILLTFVVQVGFTAGALWAVIWGMKEFWSDSRWSGKSFLVWAACFILVFLVLTWMFWIRIPISAMKEL